MKRFIIIFALMLVAFVSNAQYNNQFIRQENATPAQWSEWTNLMNQYNKSKMNTYIGLGIGAVGVTTFAIMRQLNYNQMEVGSDIWSHNGVTIEREKLDTAYTIGMYSVGVGALVAVGWNLIKRKDARHRIDRFYFYFCRS